MNYTRPNNDNYDDKPEDWLFGALTFACALSYALPEGQGIVVDLSEDMQKIYPAAKRIIVCHIEGQIRIEDADERTDLEEGDWVNMINEDTIIN